jgi:excisionase family DNA binding protein
LAFSQRLGKETAFASSLTKAGKTDTPTVTCFEHPSIEVEQFLAMLRFENRGTWRWLNCPRTWRFTMDSLLSHDDLVGTVLEKHLSVKAAAETFGYNEQYLRRILRAGRLEGIKIGQVWLIKLASLEAHLCKGQLSRDQRWGPQGVPADFAKGVTT